MKGDVCNQPSFELSQKVTDVEVDWKIEMAGCYQPVWGG